MVNILRKRLHAGCCIVFSSCLFIILYSSCQKKRDDSLFLQKYEYKLWYIVKESEPQDSSEWIQLGSFKIEPSWEEDVSIWDWGEDYQPSIAYDWSHDRAWYYNYINTRKRPRYFVKKGETPEYLYMDRDGYACVLYFDRNAANFFEKPEAEMTGHWSLKNDSIMLLNNVRYLCRQTGANPTTIQVKNLQTGMRMQIVDANIPYVCDHAVTWSDDEEMLHKEKWGYGIKGSPLLQGSDSKLWREEDNFGIYDPYDTHVALETDYFERRYYYCMFMYFDKYGRYADLAIDGRKWRMWEHYYPDIDVDDYKLTTYWYLNGNDSTQCIFQIASISYTHPDTLNLRNVATGEKIRYIAINLPPKSKWEKSKK